MGVGAETDGTLSPFGPTSSRVDARSASGPDGWSAERYGRGRTASPGSLFTVAPGIGIGSAGAGGCFSSSVSGGRGATIST